MANTKESLEGLLPYCTPRQEELLRAWIKNGSGSAAAKEIGVGERRARTMLALVKKRAAEKGFIPSMELVRPAPEESNLRMSGASIYRDGIWHKYKMDERAEDANSLLDEYEDRIKSFKPFPRVKAPKKTNKDLLAVLPLGDPHIGMYSWHKETGEDFDCDIAEKNLTEAFMLLMDKIPATETLMILNLGDFFHSDSPSNRTERGGNHLDVDGRWFRVLMIGLELMNQCVDLALKKHKKVIVRNNAGNHDPQTAKVLSAAMMQTYRKNPRVEVYQPENDIMFYEFGRNMICGSHGHFFKSQKAPSIMATYEPEMWGRTQHRFFFYGHIHHKNVKEDGGVVTESFNTLAARDAWHHASGYLSQRQSEALVFHKECLSWSFYPHH